MKINKLFIGSLIIGIGAIFFINAKINTKQSPFLANSLSATKAVTIGSVAPEFTLTTLDKKTFKLSGKRGKTVILFAMAGWCGTCIPEGRNLTKIRKEYSDKGVEVIGVAFTKGDNEDFLKEFSELGTINIPLALDTDNVASKYQLVRLETTYIINKYGVIVYKDEGFTSYEAYKRELDKII